MQKLSEKLIQAIIDALPMHLYWTTKDTKIAGANLSQALNFGDKSVEDCIGKDTYDFAEQLGWNKEFADNLHHEHLDIIKTGKGSTAEYSEKLADGKNYNYLSYKYPLIIDGEVEGIVGISVDITEKKEMQEQLHQAEVREKSQNERITAMKRMGGSIAHELRTPLAGLGGGIYTINQIMPDLFKTYKIARQNKLDVPIINRSRFDQLLDLTSHMNDELESASTMINILLKNINTNEITNPQDYGTYDIFKIIKDAVTYYPANEFQRKAIHISVEEDKNFNFNGSSILVRHVLYNLIKNALFYINEDKGEQITITTKLGKKFNQVIFEDSGCGIDSEILPHIFDDMFSRTMNGTGLGLAFCKLVMKNIGGSIECESEKGKYTRFILSFPVLS